MEKTSVARVTIASGQTESSAFDTEGKVLLGLYLPTAFTGTTITFLAAHKSDGTYQAVYEEAGNAISATVAQGHSVAITGIDGEALAPWRFMKLVSGSAEGADREIFIVLKG